MRPLRQKTLMLFLGLACFSTTLHAQIRPITYQLSAKNLSKKAVDSYPQTLLQFEHQDSLYRITVRTFAAYDDSAKRAIALLDRYAPPPHIREQGSTLPAGDSTNILSDRRD